MTDDSNVLREVETKWLSQRLAEAIANLGYAVGRGVAPKPEHLEIAANKLFDRYAKMIALAAGERTAPAVRGDDLAQRLEIAAGLLRNASQGVVGDSRHWMKDCAADCEQAAARLRARCLRAEVQAAAMKSLLRAIVEAVAANAVEMNSAEIDLGNGREPYRWHEEWLSEVQAALLTGANNV